MKIQSLKMIYWKLSFHSVYRQDNNRSFYSITQHRSQGVLSSHRAGAASPDIKKTRSPGKEIEYYSP